ncbi:MAG: hypothetical protein JNM59_10245 [Hyphomonadaceae bacterium]|nr:hypothetical protein [Hyphomonadaceae bacterium]
MARAKKTASAPAGDGMGLIQLMPFPALNPWNWWALAAPRNAALASLAAADAALHMMRNSADVMRTALRAQQDAMLATLQAELAPVEREASAAASAADAPVEVAEQETPDFFTPMVEATRAYGRVGKAFIVAQRNTMRAFAEGAKPH